MQKISIRAARVNANLTQAELAKILGVHRQTLAKWEENPAKMKIEKAKKMCEVLSLPLSNIFFDVYSTKRWCRKDFIMKNIDPLLGKILLKKPWLTVKDIYSIYPVGMCYSREMFKKAKEKAILEKWFIPVSRPQVVPTKHVLDLYPIRGCKK